MSMESVMELYRSKLLSRQHHDDGNLFNLKYSARIVKLKA